MAGQHFGLLQTSACLVNVVLWLRDHKNTLREGGGAVLSFKEQSKVNPFHPMKRARQCCCWSRVCSACCRCCGRRCCSPRLAGTGAPAAGRPSHLGRGEKGERGLIKHLQAGAHWANRKGCGVSTMHHGWTIPQCCLNSVLLTHDAEASRRAPQCVTPPPGPDLRS